MKINTRSSLPPLALTAPGSPSNKNESDQLTALFHNSVFDKLQAKPKIVRQITLLNSKIYRVEKALLNSQEKIDVLEGGKAARLPLIGALIKFIFKWYNKDLLASEAKENRSLHLKEGKYKQDIADLKNLLPSEDEELPGNIFALEYKIQVALEQDFPDKAKYLDLFENKIKPLIDQFKRSLRQKPYHFVASAAAAKGKAAQAGFQALKDLAEKKPVIKESNISSQQVFLLPQEGAVFKHSSERAKEEEAIVNALLDLMSHEATVGTFSIQEASVDKFGIQISAEEQLRGFTLEDLSPALRHGIVKKLGKEDVLILKKIENSPIQLDPTLLNYQEMAKQDWYVREEGEWKVKSLKELQQLNLTGQLKNSTLIGTSKKTAVSFREHLLGNEEKGSSFAQALHYFPTLQESSPTLILSPDLSDNETKMVYKQCESCKWSYVDSTQTSHEVDFKTLHSLYLQKEHLQNIKPIGEKSPLPSTMNLYQSLNVDWKAISSEVMQIEHGSISELNNIEAKPFVKEMILMKELSESARKALLDRLTPDAEFNAILTGEVQLLDMYSSNLGVAPEVTAEYEHFKNVQFDLPSGQKNFKNLVLDYLSNKINLNTLISYEESGTIIEKPLKDIPALQKALNCRWQFVIFDTDLSLSEDNRLQMQTYHDVPQHLIPLRSVLLETEWKDKPLSLEAIERLFDSTERDSRVKKWIKKEDAPIYKQLLPAVRKEIVEYVTPFIKNYSLSEPRKNGEEVTIAQLNKQFCLELCDPIDHFELWQKLEEALSYVPVRSNDTWESIAKRYEQDINELKKLNPGNIIPIPGKKIKIQYDITSSFPTAVKKRERIANQLFPRITFRQQEALLERQKNRKDYLFNYQNLLDSRFEGNNLLKQLVDFVKESNTPLDSLRKDQLLSELSNKTVLLSNPKKLDALKKEICRECQPTYFNLMKAMFPLLADAYALNAELHHNKAIAGKNIGLFSQPLEESIAQALASASSSKTHQFAILLQAKMQSISDPAFFGHWG